MDTWPTPRVTPLRQPHSPSLAVSFHHKDFDYLAALMSTQTCCHLREVSLARQLQASPMKSRSPVHCTSLKCTIAAVQVSSGSPPLLNASLSSAFSWHYRVPPDAGRCPAGSPGLPSSEAPTLRSPTGGSPGCTRVRGRSTGDGEDRRCTPPSHSPTAEEMGGDPRSPRPRCPRARRRP